MLTKDELPECPVATTLQLLNTKWKIYILQRLLVKPCRFNEMKNSIAGISQNALSDNLRQMEDDGIILRQDNGTFPRHVEYSLSELGKMMLPIIQSLHEFGTEYKKIISETKKDTQLSPRA